MIVCLEVYRIGLAEFADGVQLEDMTWITTTMCLVALVICQVLLIHNYDRYTNARKSISSLSLLNCHDL